MTAKQTFYIMLGGIIVLFGLCIAGTYFAHKMLVSEGEKLYELKLQQAVLDKQEDALAQAKKDIAQYEDLEKIARTVVPQEKDQARTTLELLNMAKQSGINLSSISYPNSQLGEVQKRRNSAATDDTGDENAQAQQTTTKMVDSKTTQLTALKNPKGVYVMEITVATDAKTLTTYDQLLNYLRRLERNRRTAEVKNISINPYQEDRRFLSFSITLNSYVKP